MEDITYRAVRTLKEVPLVLAEDTRHTRILFDNFGISTPMEAYHDFNKEKVTPKYVEYLKNEGDIALVSDAGTPGVADPAFNLVRACVREGIDIRANLMKWSVDNNLIIKTLQKEDISIEEAFQKLTK